MNGTFSERVTPLMTSAMRMRVLFAFDDAGAGDQEEIAGADADVIELEGELPSSQKIKPQRTRRNTEENLCIAQCPLCHWSWVYLNLEP